jgi:DNA-binding transcriptional LysR family regulator
MICAAGKRSRDNDGGLDAPTLKQYLQSPHALGETWGGQQTLVDRPLAQLGLKRRVVLSIPFFVPAIFAIAHTDMIVTVPKRLAKMTAGMAGVRSVEPPREIEEFPYFMTWHPRVTHEPGHAWLRQLLRDVTMATRRNEISRDAQWLKKPEPKAPTGGYNGKDQ